MSDVLVTIAEGQIRGSSSTDASGRECFIFLGIPYAKPPLGPLRFKDPEPPEPWSGILDCTRDGDTCYAKQAKLGLDGIVPVIEGSEDCLNLNVSTPTISGDAKPLPVMLNIHGGGFYNGSGSIDQFGPKLLLTKDVVLVNINYRVGALGFLSLESQSVGNAGLKDMVRALQWVNQNIKQFGGDPNNVTVFGESAGGVAVHYLTLSPSTKNLMHKAIAQSGCALGPASVGEQNNARDIAKAMGCTETDDAKIFEFLQNVSKEDLLSAQDNQLGDDFDAFKIRPFSPTVEPTTSSNAFITEIPADLVLAGKFHQIPFLLGCNSMEGMFFVEMKGIDQIFPIDYTNFVPHYVGGKSKPGLNKKIMNFYFGQDDVDMANRQGLYEVLGDVNFTRPAWTAARNHASKSSRPVYLYQFSCETQLDYIKQLMGITTPGVPHAGDLIYLFKNTVEPELEPGTPEWFGVERMITMWTNFAKTGMPIPSPDDYLLNVEWKPVENGQMNFLDIGNDLVAGIEPDGERVKFWDQIYTDLADKY